MTSFMDLTRNIFQKRFWTKTKLGVQFLIDEPLYSVTVGSERGSYAKPLYAVFFTYKTEIESLL